MADADARNRAILERAIVARERAEAARERARLAGLHAHDASARSRALSKAQCARRKRTTARLQALRTRGGRPTAASDVACGDPHVRMLAGLFCQHPAWVRAAGHVADGAESAVSFSHLPGRSWRLVRRNHESLLLPGRARDPDFAFRFTPAAVERLAAVEGDVGDFAVELFARIVEPRTERRVDCRVIAPFSRLARRGYVRLLLAAGPKVARFGATRGVTTLRDLRAAAIERRGDVLYEGAARERTASRRRTR